jgi:DNA-binding LacI/PurR family transcriptional regulator
MEEMLPLAERRERLVNNPCDGYLVMDGWAKDFYETDPPKDIPVLFGVNSCWKHVAHYEPKVALDDLEAINRGIEILAQEGYRRIGMISVGAMYHPNDLEEKTYQDTMARCGLDFRSINNLPFNLSQIISSVQKIFSRPDRPDAIYVHDDYIMVGVAEALEVMGLKAGRDVGVITLSTTHHHLPKHNLWSKMEFNNRHYGEVLVDNLLRLIETSDHRLNNIMFQARWVAGQSHQRSQK